MVAAGGATFDLHDDLCRFERRGDVQHLADLVDGAGLERHIREAVLVERAHQLHGFVELRDAGGDDDAVDRGARRAFARHEALAAELEVPQVTVHEHRVEFDGRTFAQLAFKLIHMRVEHILRHLAAACEFRPITIVRGRRHDFRIHGGGRHAGEQHRLLAGEAGECSAHFTAVGCHDDARRERRPVGETLRFAFEFHGGDAVLRRGERDDARARAVHERRREFGCRGARAEVHEPHLRGIRLGERIIHLLLPIHIIGEHLGCETLSLRAIEPAFARPCRHLLHRRLHEPGVEGHGDFEIFHGWVEHLAAAHLLGAQLRLALMLAADLLLELGEVGGMAGDDHVRAGVDDADVDGACRVVHTADELLHLGARGAFDRHHRGCAALPVESQQMGLAGASRADEPGDGEDAHDGVAFGLCVRRLMGGLHHVHGEHALRMPQGCDRGNGGCLEAQVCGGEHRAQLGKGDARHAHGGIGGLSQYRGVAGIVEQVDALAGGGKQVGGDGLEQALGVRCQGVQAVGKVGVIGQLLERCRPRRGLACEGQDDLFVAQACQEGCHGSSCLVL